MSSKHFQSGDSVSRDEQYDTFVRLLSRHDVFLRRFIRSLLPSSDGVDDVVQETALECWRKFSDFSATAADADAAEFRRWACVIARFKALSWQRNQGRDRLVFREDVIERLFDDAMTSIDRHESERVAVEHCLKKLEAKERRLILSIHRPGESVAAIAKETGESVRRLYSRVNELREMLLRCVRSQVPVESSYE